MPSSVSSSTAQLLAAAAHCVAEVAHGGRALDEALEERAGRKDAGEPPEGVRRAALQALSFGTLRWQPRIGCWIAALVQRPLALTPEIHALLSVGLHQLEYSHHPPHAIVDGAVAAARVLRQPHAAGLVNAVLRRFLREGTGLRERVMRDPVGRYAHPEWLMDRIRADWPAEWQGILEANNQPPPLWLRVNRVRGSVAEYLNLLSEQGLSAAPQSVALARGAPDALLMLKPVEVGELPQFENGRVSVQDAAAQWAAGLLEARPRMRVLDACAAPGGKTCQVLEHTPDLEELVALDRSPPRLERVEQNLRRLGLRARILAGDAARPQDWWDKRPFHRILLDAPCSATGVIRRHPDIKLLRRPADIPALAAGQLRLLHALWPLLEPGGRLLYASCSILKAENHAVIAAFIGAEPTAMEHGFPQAPACGRRSQELPGLQILPGEANMDGFYYACLEKRLS